MPIPGLTSMSYIPPLKTYVIFLTATGGSPWVVPSNFVSLVSVEAIGASSTVQSATDGTTGGVGGDYAKITSDASVVANASIPYAVGTNLSTSIAVAGGDTWFDTTAKLLAKGGLSASTSVGSVINAGGTGGVTGSNQGGGGGGAGGPAGVGGNGAAGGASSGGVGGSADGGAVAGGAGGVTGSHAGIAGSMETLWTQTSDGAVAGPGSGGGGSFFSGGVAQHSPNGTRYGGAPGGNGKGSPNSTVSPQGSPGIIVVTFKGF